MRQPSKATLRQGFVLMSEWFVHGRHHRIEDVENKIVHVGRESGTTFLIHYTDEEKLAYYREHGNFPKLDFYEKVISGTDPSRENAEFVVEQAYPAGESWHVEARRLKNGKYDGGGELIMFYEDGFIGNDIPSSKIKVVRKMKLSFS